MEVITVINSIYYLINTFENRIALLKTGLLTLPNTQTYILLDYSSIKEFIKLNPSPVSRSMQKVH